MKLTALFSEHPASVGETYGQHMRVAFSFAGPLVVAGLACFVHGLFPFLFTTTGSRTVATLHERMVINRRHQSNPLRPVKAKRQVNGR
jgi:hypothetical protein